ncbi:prevent-host-death protein [Nocardia cerradoensis]|nr:prevent-host-death protein [Nocardia cerradoensis]
MSPKSENTQHDLGRLVSLRRRRRFVARLDFASMSRATPALDVSSFRADQDHTADQESDDPYEC